MHRNDRGATVKQRGERFGKAIRLGGSAAAILCGVSFVQASPSGLNNTPTADSCAEQTLVLQTWSGFGAEMKPDHWVGAKYGVFKNEAFGGLEVGADWKLNGDPSRPPVFQGKYAIGIGKTGPQLSVGIANLSTDRDLNGEPMPYGVVSYDLLGALRVHAGYGFQKGNEGAFGGLDRTFDLGGVSLTLCGDIVQQNKRRDVLVAPGIKIGASGCKREGLLGAILRNTSFETWVNFPPHGAAESYVAKLDYAVHF